jgi:16S rRNA processing protein RimM
LATFGNFAKRKVADKVVAGESVADETAVAEPLAVVPGADAGASAGASIKGALPDDLVEVGVVVDAYGVKGWVKIQPHAQDGHGGDAMVRARHWWIAARLPLVGRPAGGGPGGSRNEPRAPLRLASVSDAKMHSGSVVAHLAGFADRDQALAARGTTVHVRRADFPKLPQDEFYWVDLIGLSVVNTGGEVLGDVVGLIDNGAHSVMRIVAPESAAGAQPGEVQAEVKPAEAEQAEAAGGTRAAKGARGAKGREPAVATDERLIPFVDAYVRSVDLAARKIVVDWGLDY